MSVYTINGVKQSHIYDIDGQDLASAYDIYGGQVFPDGEGGVKPQLRVMSYNVQHFTGINAQLEMQNEIIDTYSPDIIGFQEFSTTQAIPTVGQEILVDYPTVILSNHINFNAIATKIPMSNILISDFVDQDPEEMERWGETRAYLKGYITFAGKRICFINTHLTVLDAAVRYAQTEQLLDLIKDEEYFIITADMNTNYKVFTGDAYIKTIKLFVDAGYNVMNNTPSTGIVNTYTSRSTAENLADMTANPDNIIVSGNITFKERVFDTIKLKYLNGNTIDHIGLCATIEL